MVRFLSHEWIDALGRAAAAAPSLVLDDGVELTIQHVVTDRPGDDDDAVYHLRLSDRPAMAASGPASDPTVTFTQSYRTAAAVASGERSAQAAFMAGELRVGGLVDVLMTHHVALSKVDDAFAGLRADTEY